MGFSVSSDPLRHIQMGPPPQTKPSMQDIGQLWGMASPEADAQRALMQYKLSSEQAGDQYAGNFGGAPTMDAAHLALSHEQHMDMLPWKMMQTQALQDKDRDRVAGDQFAQQQPEHYPNYEAYKYGTQQSEHQAAMQALEHSRRMEEQSHQQGQDEHAAGLLAQHPEWFTQHDAKHPGMPGGDQIKQLLMQSNPRLQGILGQQNNPGLPPKMQATLNNQLY